MPSQTSSQFGELPPQYNFIVNPYPDVRLTKCPICEEKMGQRKLPLVIHIDPANLIALNYTCRYCRRCDLLAAHKHEIEHLLTNLFHQVDPKVIGSDYLIVGTMEKSAWKASSKQPASISEMRAHIHDFKEVYRELRVSEQGWYPRGQEPPVRQPPPSEDWVKVDTARSRRL